MINQSGSSPQLAALPNASWLPKPDPRTSKRVHVLRAYGHAACGMIAVMCDPELAKDIPNWQRCRRPDCREKWYTIE